MSMKTEESMDVDSSVQLIIDGKATEAAVGDNLLQTLLNHDLDIPRLCYHQALSPQGGCRLCLVEVNGTLVSSCDFSLNDDCRVNTDTPAVIEARNFSIQSILHQHHLECSQCAQLGKCDLQKISTGCITKEIEMPESDTTVGETYKLGDSMLLRSAYCIDCQLCTRFVDEILQLPILSILKTKSGVKVFQSGEINNLFSKNLIDICPVGAIVDSQRSTMHYWQGQKWETACPGCSVNCAVVCARDENDNYVVSSAMSERNGHWICNEGRGSLSHLNDYFRIEKPVSFVEGMPREVSTEVLLQFMQEKKTVIILNFEMTCEEIEDVFLWAEASDIVFYWPPTDNFPQAELLERESPMANYEGIAEIFDKWQRPLSPEYTNKVLKSIDTQTCVFMSIPEFHHGKGHLEDFFAQFHLAQHKVALTTVTYGGMLNDFDYLLPVQSFAEKRGTIIANNKAVHLKSPVGEYERFPTFGQYTKWFFSGNGQEFLNLYGGLQ